ncbi:MAG: sorbosone dehydrogenase family protein [Cytophagaceae bacterium]|jgi:glucose/arabinose dehydrogenase|nr:sorbosone dehydrogenase family protein [Cytophagaceae bacterium]
MKMKYLILATFILQFFQASAQAPKNKEAQSDTLSLPNSTKSVTNFSNVIGWKENEKPTAPEGFEVSKYADGFQNPRWLYILPNGDVLVAESNSNYSTIKKVGGVIIGANKSNDLSNSANRITLLRDANKDGVPEVRETFLENLNQPFGMLVIGNWFYVANTDELLRFPYKPGQTKITGKGEKITDLAAGKNNQHWTRNIIANAKGTKIYIAVGSGSNVGENGMEEENGKACIIEISPDGQHKKTYANGLRNPVGMGWAPGTTTLWTAVNERDGLGDDLVPDYLTSVQQGGFYGWPYSYFGQYEDPRIKEEDKKPELVKKAIAPEVDLGSHTASLGLAFYTKKAFPTKYHNGAFIGQHGSWNRSTLSGYKVVFVPFKNGKPDGIPEDFLTGFIVDLEKSEVRGRPVAVVVTPDGSILVTDDVSNTIWKVSAASKK